MKSAREILPKVVQGLSLPKGTQGLNGKSLNKFEECVKYHFGEDYINADFDDFKPKGEAQSKVLEMLSRTDILNENLYFVGNNRTGKTYFLAAIYRQILKAYGAGRSTTEIFSDKSLEKDLIDAHFYRERDYFNLAYGTRNYYIFKDFGKFDTTKELVLTPLYDFMDFLFSNSKSKRMYFASNFTPDELAKCGDKMQSIAARINEKCKIISL